MPVATQPRAAGLIGLLTVGLKSNARAVLEEAASRGFISPSDIADIIPKQTGKNPLLLKRAVDSIRACLDTLGVVIVMPSAATQLRTVSPEKKVEAPKPPPLAVRPVSVTPRPEPVRTTRTIKVIPAKLEKVEVKKEEEEASEEWVAYYDRDLLSVYMKSLQPYKMLPDEKVRKLASTAREGDVEARNTLVLHNLRLAVKMAFGKQWRIKETSLTLLDLIQEGNLGLMRAAEEFDERLGYRFSTYAHWWTLQAMLRAIHDTGHLVRAPVHRQELWGKIERHRQRFLRRFGHEPRLRTLAAFMGTTEEVIEEALKQKRLTPGLVEKIVELDFAWDENPEDQKGRGPLHGSIEDSMELGPDQTLQSKEELEQTLHRIRLILAVAKTSSLSERDIEMFKARYGLDGTFESKTLEEVAQPYHLTRERVRQIVDLKVWPKLRELGVKQDGAWLEEELRRIRALENLTGKEAQL